jgi:hypothetical protein
MRARSWLALGLLALAAASAGCLQASPLADLAEAEADEGPDPPTGTPATNELRLRLAPTAGAAGLVGVEDVRIEPLPAPAETFHLGGADALEEGPATLASFHVPEGATLDAFRLHVVVDDGLGPAALTFEVPAWTAHAPASATVHLDAAEAGSAVVDRVDGGVALEPVNATAQPRYGVLEWPDGPRTALTGFDHTVRVPEAYPRFPADAEPTFEADAPVAWSLDGDVVREGHAADLDPGPGAHELVLEGPNEQSTTLEFSIHDRLHVENRILVGTPGHREPVADANADTHNVTVHDGATHLSASLASLGDDRPLQDLDLYALNATGGVLDQSADSNSSDERLVLSRTDLASTDTVQLRVHGDEAAGVEYKLTATTFYRPW